MWSPYWTKCSSFSISNLHATKFQMILCRSTSKFICRWRKSLPFNLWSFPFVVILSADVCLLILSSSCLITTSNDLTSTSLAWISCAVPAFAFCSKAFLACPRCSFFVLRISFLSRMSAITWSAVFLLCPEMKSVDRTAGEWLHYKCGAEASCVSICTFHLHSRVARGTPDCWSLRLASVWWLRALVIFLCTQRPISSRFCFSNQWSWESSANRCLQYYI